MTGRRGRPPKPDARQETVDQWHERRTHDEAPERSVRFEETELDIERDHRHQKCEDHPARAGVRRGLGVGNHEERENQQSDALDLMQRDRQRVAEPESSRDEQTDVESEKAQGHIRARRPRHDEASHPGDEQAEPDDLPPLSRRDPSEAGGDRDDQREIRGIEDVLLAPPDDELAGNGDEGRQCDDSQIVGAEEDAQADDRYESAERIEPGQLVQARAGILREQRRAERDGDLGDGDVKVQPAEAIEQQGAQADDLIEAGIKGGKPGCESIQVHQAPRG